MKILFYINVLSSGGAERVVSNLANKLAENDEVIVVNSFKTENEYNLTPKIKHIYLDNRHDKSFIKKNIYLIGKLRAILKKERPNVAISFMAEPNFRLLISSFFLKTKTIISIRNDPNKEYPNILFRFLAKTLFLKADGIVFQTLDARNFFQKSIQRKSVIIYNPVKESFYRNPNNKTRRNIVAVGRLSMQKNHFLLINAFAKVSKHIQENLYIYGEGDMRKQLQDRINDLNLNDRVFLQGNVSDLNEILSNYKLYVLSSDFEGMPNSLMEAMASGLPCISTDCPCGGPKELLPIDCLTPVNDIEKLSNKIIEFINDNERLIYLGKVNSQKALEFTNDKITNAWRKYIIKTISS